jgi:methylenetetrahydrofolate reductase (NADPH)
MSDFQQKDSSSSLPRKATQSWDDHPNGRFGDVSSPAYGELDGWGVSLKLTREEALQAWGQPTRSSDISDIFARYLQSSLQTLPWSDMPLMSETAEIVPQLLRLVKEKQWWTVGSQPAVDGIRSEDQRYGFGPKGGYIYQKAFVEFWARKEDVERVASQAEQLQRKTGIREVTFYAAGRDKSQFKTNMEKGDANAVTWGVFAGQEIVTTTLIEEISFRTWKVRFSN